MTQTEKRAWEFVRAKGRNRFLLREGILRRGLPSGVIFTLIHQAIQVWHFGSPPDSLLSLIMRWLFFSVAFGAGMGLYYCGAMSGITDRLGKI